MKTILITGASKGIGKGLADYYRSAGHGANLNVEGCARRAADDSTYACDVTNEEEVRSMLSLIGKVDILINCAGVASMNHLLLTPTETMQRVLNTNLLGTMLMCREVGKMMVRQRWGRIINVSTVAVPLSLEGEAVYVASKAGVEALTKVLAKELAPLITVNCVAPTVVSSSRLGTSGWLVGLSENVGWEKLQVLLNKTATRQPCTVEDIAKVIDFFINNDMVTGQTIYLGGV